MECIIWISKFPSDSDSVCLQWDVSVIIPNLYDYNDGTFFFFFFFFFVPTAVIRPLYSSALEKYEDRLCLMGFTPVELNTRAVVNNRNLKFHTAPVSIIHAFVFLSIFSLPFISLSVSFRHDFKWIQCHYIVNTSGFFWEKKNLRT